MKEGILTQPLKNYWRITNLHYKKNQDMKKLKGNPKLAIWEIER